MNPCASSTSRTFLLCWDTPVWAGSVPLESDEVSGTPLVDDPTSGVVSDAKVVLESGSVVVSFVGAGVSSVESEGSSVSSGSVSSVFVVFFVFFFFFVVSSVLLQAERTIKPDSKNAIHLHDFFIFHSLPVANALSPPHFFFLAVYQIFLKKKKTDPYESVLLGGTTRI